MYQVGKEIKELENDARSNKYKETYSSFVLTLSCNPNYIVAIYLPREPVKSSLIIDLFIYKFVTHDCLPRFIHHSLCKMG